MIALFFLFTVCPNICWNQLVVPASAVQIDDQQGAAQYMTLGIHNTVHSTHEKSVVGGLNCFQVHIESTKSVLVHLAHPVLYCLFPVPY